MHRLLLLTIVLAACSKSSSKQSPSAKPQETAAAPAQTAPNTAAPCRDGSRAKMKEWMGLGSITLTVACKQGKATLEVDSDDAHSDEDSEETPTLTFALTSDEWNTLWKQLDTARWRDLACADKGDPDVGDGLTDLDLEITDGTTTKVTTCSTMSLSSQHGQIIDAFEKLSDVATERAADAADCVEGKSATMKQWIFGVKAANTITVACRGGIPKLEFVDAEETTNLTYTLTRETWDAMWEQLDAASWHDVGTACSKKSRAVSNKYGSFESQGIEKVELRVTDRTETTKIACKAANLTSQHIPIFDAIGDAMLEAVKSPST